jgi:phosphinothricin acetyltransferase
VDDVISRRTRIAFEASDHGVYLADDIAGKGWGKKLLMQLCEQAEKAGLRKMIAVIGDSDNAGSIGVHASLGFQHVGRISGCGWKFDRWLDIVMMEKELGLGQSQPPPDGD